MRILLVQPATPADSYSIHDVAFMARSGIRARTPPIGLVTLAALTPPPHHVRIHDERVLGPVSPPDPPVDIVGIHLASASVERVQELLAWAERVLPEALAVVGGPGTSTATREQLGPVDVVIHGEAELTWPRFLEEAATGTHAAEYPAEPDLDLAHSPPPRWDLLPQLHRYQTGAVQTTRGCPHDCSFCEIPALHGRRPRHKPVGQILAEVATLVELGFTLIYLTDDNLVGDPAYARELLVGLVRQRRTLSPSPQLVAQVDVTVARRPELMDLLADAGFGAVYMGLETPDRAGLRAVNKLHNLRVDPVEVVRALQSRGVLVFGFLLGGLDTDDLGSFERMATFMHQASLCIAPTSLVFAYPGTRLYEQVRSEGRLVRRLPVDLGAELNADQGLSNVVPLGLDRHACLLAWADHLERVTEPADFVVRVEGLLGGVERPPPRGNGAWRLLWANARLGWHFLSWLVLRANGATRRAAVQVAWLTLVRAPSMALRMLSLFVHFCAYAGRERDKAARARTMVERERRDPGSVEVVVPAS